MTKDYNPAVATQIAQSEARRAIEDALAPVEHRIEARIDALAKQFELLRQTIDTLKEERIGFAVVEQWLTHAELNIERLKHGVEGCERQMNMLERDLAQVQATLRTLSADITTIKHARDAEATERRKAMIRYGGLSGLVATLIPLLIWLLQLASGANVGPPPSLPQQQEEPIEQPTPPR